MIFSAPYEGEEFELKQPDGSYVTVKVYGDEFYTRVEGLDGYSLIRDPKTGWICYADLSKEGKFILTGKVYKGKKSKPLKKLKKHLEESKKVIERKRKKAEEELKN